MKIFLRFVLMVLFFGSGQVLASDYSVFETELNELNEKLQGDYDTKRVNRYIRSCKRFLDRIGIDNKIISVDGEKSLIILPSRKKNNLNKLAYSLDQNFKKLVFEINPHATIKEGEVGSYVRDDHKFVVDKLTVALLNLSDTTVHHEIRHAMMTYRYLQNSIESVFSYELVLLKPEVIQEKTGYEKYLSLQELSTYPIEALQQLSLYQHRFKMQNDELLQSIEETIEHSLKISKYTVEFIKNFDLKNSQYEVLSEMYLNNEYKYIKATSLDTYQVTIPYFEKQPHSEAHDIFKNALDLSYNLAYDVWIASVEALKTLEQYKEGPSSEKFLVLRDKIKALTAASRKYL